VLAQIVKLNEARDLGLEGRKSLAILSAEKNSSAVTLRHVEIPVASADDQVREPHSHPDTEECIHVLSGRGVFCTNASETELARGDTVLVPTGELHVTRNIGNVPLVLLCFFPVGKLDAHG
jgi:quercetin dioxygenase-like cupin family protein